MSSYSRSLELNANGSNGVGVGVGGVCEEQVIDDYYVSLQNGEIDSRHRIKHQLENKNNKQQSNDDQLLEQLKQHLHNDLDKIASQINLSGKNKWRNSTKSTSAAPKNKHIRFSSGSDNDEEKVTALNGAETETLSETNNRKESQLQFSKKKSPPSPSRKENDKKKKNPVARKEYDYKLLQDLNCAPRVNERIAFQILEISANFTPEVSEYKIGTVVEFDAKTNEVTLALHSEYNSILKRPSKFSVVFDETEDELNSLVHESPKSPRENEMLKVDWRNLMNVKLIPMELDLAEVLGQQCGQQQQENDESADEQSEEQVIDDYYQTVQNVDRYNKNRKNQQNRQQQQKRVDIETVKQVNKQPQEQQTKQVNKKQNIGVNNNKTAVSVVADADLDKIASSVNAHAKAKWKNSAPPKSVTNPSNAPKHIRFSSSSLSSSSCSSSSTSSSEMSSNDEDSQQAQCNKKKPEQKHKTNGLKTRDEEKSGGKHHVSNNNNNNNSNKQEQAKKTIEISTSTRSHNQSAVKQHQTVIHQSPQPTSNNKITQTKRDESHIGGDPKFAYNTQSFMIQIGNVLELNSDSNQVTLKFNSNCNSEINLKITNNDQNEKSELSKKRKKPEKSLELDWKNSMNVKLIPNEISLNMKSRQEGDTSGRDDDDGQSEKDNCEEKDSSSSTMRRKNNEKRSNVSLSGSNGRNNNKEEEAATRRHDNDRDSNSDQRSREKRKNSPVAQKLASKQPLASQSQSDSSKKTPKHIRFPSSSSSSSSASSSSSSDSSSSSSSSESDDEEERMKKSSKQARPSPRSGEKQQQQQKQPQQQQKLVKNEDSKISPNKSTAQQNNNNKSPRQRQQQQQQANKYYEPSKEEQLEAESYNRSYLIQNPKDLVNFKKVFNQSKLNAPEPELFVSSDAMINPNGYQQQIEFQSELVIDEHARAQENQPQTTTTTASQVDYTQCEALYGMPSINDKIAFQVLEITPEYTPQVSSYKVATVLGISPNGTEISLKLDEPPSESILEKPGKFSIVTESSETSSLEMDRPSLTNFDETNVKMDWANMLNVRLVQKASN